MNINRSKIIGVITVEIKNLCMQFDTESELMAFDKKLEGRRFSEQSESIGILDENHRKHTKESLQRLIETE